ncbi:MAG TPA: nuclear transport factor 2 family protein [Acidimicrobiales bacterium]|nr:nuclear transport factor 2 family protein [Acidimicrobiales bacterium]
MTAADPSIATLARIVAAFNANDTQTLRTLVSEDFDYVLEGKSPIAGRYRGHQGMQDFMRAIHGAAGGTLKVEPLGVSADDRFVIMYATLTAERNGRRLEGQNVYIYEFDAGKLRTGRNVPCDAYAWDEFWSG